MSSTIPFSAAYTYNGNGTVQSAAFRNPGVPAAVKQYTYSHTYDEANRMDSAGASGFTSSLAFEVEVPNYSSGSRIPQVRRRTETGSLVDDVLFSYDKATSTRPTRLIDFRSSGGATWDIGGPFSRDSIFYDANGNMTGVQGTPYSITAATYDHSNQPTSITAGGVTSDYRYGASGFRISKKEGSADEVFYIREGLVQLAVITISGTTVQDSEFKLLAGTQVVGRQPASGNPRYYHTDMLGSVRSVVDGATILEGHDYFPFGTPMPGRTTTSSSTREGFSGNEVDAATNLSYFGARYYLPLYGVFNARDPLADEFDMVSPYLYALGDPVSLVDPLGFCADGGDDDCAAIVALLLHLAQTTGAEVFATAATAYETTQIPVFVVSTDDPRLFNVDKFGINRCDTPSKDGCRSGSATSERVLVTGAFRGDLALTAVHESLHLRDNPEFPGGLTHVVGSARFRNSTFWREREREAYNALPNPGYYPAPFHRYRLSVAGIAVPPITLPPPVGR